MTLLPHNDNTGTQVRGYYTSNAANTSAAFVGSATVGYAAGATLIKAFRYFTQQEFWYIDGVGELAVAPALAGLTVAAEPIPSTGGSSGGSSGGGSSPPVPATTAGRDALTLVLYDVVDGEANLRGYQVGTEVQPLGWSGGARLVIGTAAGNASNLRTPGPVLLKEHTCQPCSAISEVSPFVVPAQNATVVVTAMVGGANAVTAPAVANGVIGGNAADLTEIQEVGQYLFAASDDGLRVAGLYRVVSGAIATGLTIRRVDDGNITLVENSGQALIAVGASTAGAMHLAAYSRLEPLAGQTFWTVQGVSGRKVLSGAFEDFASSDASLRSGAVQNFIQLSSRNLVFSSRLGALHGRFPIGEYLGDGDSADVLGSDVLYMHGKGDKTGEKDALSIVSWWAGSSPGSANA
jgi:hypothetical protein